MTKDAFRGMTKDRDKARRLVRAAERAGWKVVISKSNHVKFIGPQGQLVVASLTATSGRAIVNLESRLRKEGVTLDG